MLKNVDCRLLILQRGSRWKLNSSKRARQHSCPALLRSKILLVQMVLHHKKLPDIVIHAIVFWRPQVGAKGQWQPTQELYQLTVSSFHMPVLQIIHIKAGHHMANSQLRQLVQGLLQIVE